MTHHLASGCCICEIRSGQEAIEYRPDLKLRRCGRCGLAYQDRAFSTAELSNIYNDTYYDHWGAKQNFDYILGTFQKYTPGIISRFLQIIKRLISDGLAKASMCFQTKILAIARRTDVF